MEVKYIKRKEVNFSSNSEYHVTEIEEKIK